MAKNHHPGRPDSLAFWQQHNQAWEQSNISQPEYCRQHGLKLSTFGYWRQKLTRSGQPTAQATDFVKISATAGEAPRLSGLELVVGDEIVIKIGNHFDPELLIKVVRAIRRML